VKKVSADVLDPGMDLSDLAPLLVPIVGALLSTGQTALSTFKSLEIRFERARRLNRLPVRKGGCRFNAEIDTGDIIRGSWFEVITDVYLDRDKPPIRFAGNRRGHDLTGEAKLFGKPDGADDRQDGSARRDPELVVCNVKRISTFSALFTRWAFRRFFEKCGKRFLQVGKRLRVSITVNTFKPRELDILYRVELLFQFRSRWFLAGGVLAIPFCQSPVPNESGRTASLAEVGFLLLGRIQSDAVG
jgi:hypothetical protein